MTTIEAKKTGRKKMLNATATLLLILIILFVIKSGGDANNILFLFAGIFNPITLLLIAIIFGLTYLFGAYAGKEIIIQNKRGIAVAFKYVPLIALSTSIYTMSFDFIKDKNFSQFIHVLYQFIIATILLLLAWAINKIKTQKTEQV